MRRLGVSETKFVLRAVMVAVGRLNREWLRRTPDEPDRRLERLDEVISIRQRPLKHDCGIDPTPSCIEGNGAAVSPATLVIVGGFRCRLPIPMLDADAASSAFQY